MDRRLVMVLAALVSAALTCGLVAAQQEDLPSVVPAPERARHAALDGGPGAAEQARLGLMLYHQDHYEVASTLLGAAAEALPDDTRIQRYVVYARFHAGQLGTDDLAALKTRAESDTARTIDHLAYADACFLNNKLDDAWLHMRAARADSAENPFFHVLHSRLCSRLRDSKGARASAERALELAPTDPVVLASVLPFMRDQSVESRLELISAGLADWPTSLSLQLMLPDLYQQAERPEQAAESVERIRTLFPESEKVHRLLSARAQQAGQNEEWLALAEKRMVDNPDDNNALIGYAKALAGAGSPATALAMVEERLLGSPGDRQLRRALASIWQTLEASSEVEAGEVEDSDEIAAESSTEAMADKVWFSFDQALREAEESQALVLAYFPGEGPWAEKMDLVFEDQSLTESLEDVVLARAETLEAGTQEVPLTPSVLIFDHSGRLVHRALGYRKASRLANDLEQARSFAGSDKKLHPSPAWLSDADYAFDRARQLSRMVVMDIYTDWCGPCKEMDRTTFVDPELIKTLDTLFVPLKLNPDVDPQAQQEWSVGVFPTNYLVHHNGTILKEINDRTPAGYVQALDAEKELALVEEIGQELFSALQADRRRVFAMVHNRMPRSFLAEFDELDPRVLDGNTGWWVYEAAKNAGDLERAGKAARAFFEAEDEPGTWHAFALLANPSAETDDDAKSRVATELKRYRGRPSHQQALLISLAMRLKTKSPEDAIDTLDEAIKKGAGGSARLEKAQLLLMQGREDGALRSLNPTADDATALECLLAAIITEKQSGQDAPDLRELATALDENAGRSAYWRGQSLLRGAGDDAKATEVATLWMRIGARLQWDDAGFLNHYGYTSAKEGKNLDEAVLALQRAVSLAEEEGDGDVLGYVDSLAWALHKKGEHQRALELMQRVISDRGRPGLFDPEIAYHLGAIYAGLELNQLARQTLVRIATPGEIREGDKSEGAEARRLLDTLDSPE